MLAGVLSHCHRAETHTEEQRRARRGELHAAAVLLGILYECFSLPQLTFPGALVVVLVLLEGNFNTSPFP